MEKSQFIEEKEDAACYAGQPRNSFSEITKEFIYEFKQAFYELVEDRKQGLLENDEDGVYHLGYDCDYEDVGVGKVCVRREEIQDEDQAEEDAKDQIIEELVNGEEEATIKLLENVKFSTALNAFLRGL